MAAKKSNPSLQAVQDVSAAKPVVAPAVPVTPVVATAAVVAPKVETPAAPVAVASRVEAARDRSTVVTLIARLRDADAEVARDAAVTLGTLPVDAEAITALCGVLRNSDEYFHPVVRAAAAAALGKLKDARAIDALIHATGDSMAEASEEAAKALGLLGDRRAMPALERIVRNEANFFLEPVRRTAEEALKRIRG